MSGCCGDANLFILLLLFNKAVCDRASPTSTELYIKHTFTKLITKLINKKVSRDTVDPAKRSSADHISRGGDWGSGKWSVLTDTIVSESP